MCLDFIPFKHKEHRDNTKETKKRMKSIISIFILILLAGCKEKARHAVVFQSDFGTKDGAVNAMKGVAYSVDPGLKLYDNTHEIEAYNIWEGAYRLNQVAAFWPENTVFVSVVDPGVGTERRSVVMRSQSGHYFVTPDNGTLTLVAEALGVDEIRQIDEAVNRRNNSAGSYTFHGRDVYAYTAARLASGAISFKEVGPVLKDIVRMPYQKPVIDDSIIRGNIPVLDIQYGNVWTNINDSLFKRLKITPGDKISVRIQKEDSLYYQAIVPFVNTFGEVREGEVLGYMNSLMNFSLAVNMGSFADSFKVGSGKEWNIEVKNFKFYILNFKLVRGGKLPSFKI